MAPKRRQQTVSADERLHEAIKKAGAKILSASPDSLLLERVQEQLVELYPHRKHDTTEYDQLLHDFSEYVITQHRVEFDQQRIIEQAQAEAQQAQAPEHPAPDTVAELGTIAADATGLHDTLAELRNQELPITVPEVEAAVEGLRAITQHSNRTAWQLAMYAVKQGLISQAKAAELLGASTTSVSRRFHDGIDVGEEQKMARTDVRRTPIR